MPAETNFDKLTDGNFHEWKIYMEALLTRKDLLDYVDGTKRHPGGLEGSKKVRDFYRKQAEARSEIILRVMPSELAHCRDPDPMLIWNTLINIHSSHGRSTIIALRRRFQRLRLGHSETMSAYIARIRHLAFLLEEAGVTISDDDIILAVTSGLPHSYDSFLISLDATHDSDYTLPYVIARSINEYQRQIQYYHHTRQPQKTTDTTDEAMAVTTGNSAPRRDLAHITCFTCGNKGHYQANCPTRTPAPTPAAASSTTKQIEHAIFVEEEDSEVDEAF
jgi:hypothetical protein